MTFAFSQRSKLHKEYRPSGCDVEFSTYFVLYTLIYQPQQVLGTFGEFFWLVSLVILGNNVLCSYSCFFKFLFVIPMYYFLSFESDVKIGCKWGFYVDINVLLGSYFALCILVLEQYSYNNILLCLLMIAIMLGTRQNDTLRFFLLNILWYGWF